MNQLSSTKARDAPSVAQCVHSELPSMASNRKDPDSLAKTTNPRKKAGSARQAKVTSRAAPMPSNDDPVSIAADAVKKRPSPSR